MIATEDHRFYDTGFARIGYILSKAAQAALMCVGYKIKSRSARCPGNSTVSQQLARNMFLGERRSVLRKIIELVWALKMEAELDRDEILEFYLNRVYLGNGNYGVETAARDYFGKSAKALSLSEAAYLAAAIKRPGWNIRDGHSKALERGRLILESMKRRGYAPGHAPDSTSGSFAAVGCAAPAGRISAMCGCGHSPRSRERCVTVRTGLTRSGQV